MASEKAKELAAQQKAARKAEKERRRTSKDPKDWGKVRQVIEAYKLTRQFDPKLNLLMIAAAATSIVLMGVFGWFTNSLAASLITGVLLAALAAMLILSWRATGAAYKRYEGQPGSAQVALSMLDTKKWSYWAGIAATRQLDVVHRALGPGGLILIGEGATGRVKTLLASEAKKHEQVAYGVPVITVVMGKEEGQVPLEKLAAHLKKLPKTMQPQQITEVKQRLRALDAVRPKMPVPKGPLPSVRGLNRAMRGR